MSVAETAPPRHRTLMAAGLGVAFGFALSRIGFTDYGELHRMFRFEDPRMLLVFAVGVAGSAVAYALLRRARPMPTRQFHVGVVVGGVLFGIGWAVTGACPGVVFAQIGEGQWHALVTLAGVLLGTRLYPMLNARFFHVDTGSCG